MRTQPRFVRMEHGFQKCLGDRINGFCVWLGEIGRQESQVSGLSYSVEFGDIHEHRAEKKTFWVTNLSFLWDSQVKSGDRNAGLEFRREDLLKKQYQNHTPVLQTHPFNRQLLAIPYQWQGGVTSQPQAQQKLHSRRVHCLHRTKLSQSRSSFLLSLWATMPVIKDTLLKKDLLLV